MQARGEDLDVLPQVAVDATVTAFNTQIAGLTVELGRLSEKFKEGHPEVQKVKAQIEQLEKAKRARAVQILDGLDAEFTQLRKREAELRGGDRLAEDAGRQPEPQGDRARGAAQGGRLRQGPLRGAAPEAQRDRHRRLDPQQQRHGGGPGERAAGPGAPPEAAERHSPASWSGSCSGSASCWCATTSTTPSATPRRSSATCTSTSSPRCRATRRRTTRSPPRPTRTCAPRSSSRAATTRGQVVLVTGTAPQEGKTTTIVNLARLLAGSGEKTVVVDCDLRRAQMHQRLGLSREPGFTDFFVRHEPLSALLRPTRGRQPLRADRGPPAPEPARAARAQGRSATSSTSCGATSTGCSSTRRRSPR